MVHWAARIVVRRNFFLGGGVVVDASLSEWPVLHSLLTSIAPVVHALLSLDASLL